MSIPKGGRGKRAPYESVTVRVPEPLYDFCRALSNYYRRLSVRGEFVSAVQLIRNLEDVMAEHDMPSGNKPVISNEEQDYKAKYEALTGNLTQIKGAIVHKEKGYQRNNAGKLIDALMTLTEDDPEI